MSESTAAVLTPPPVVLAEGHLRQWKLPRPRGAGAVLKDDSVFLPRAHLARPANANEVFAARAALLYDTVVYGQLALRIVDLNLPRCRV
jgi:hypothetical protein